MDRMHDIFNNNKSVSFYTIASVILTFTNVFCYFFITTNSAITLKIESIATLIIFIVVTCIFHTVLGICVCFFICFIYKQKSYEKKYERAEKFLKEKFSDEYKRVNIVLKHGTPYIYSVTFHAVELYAKYEDMMLHIRVCDEKGNILNEESTNCFVEFLETLYPMALKR